MSDCGWSERWVGVEIWREHVPGKQFWEKEISGWRGRMENDWVCVMERHGLYPTDHGESLTSLKKKGDVMGFGLQEAYSSQEFMASSSTLANTKWPRTASPRCDEHFIGKMWFFVSVEPGSDPILTILWSWGRFLFFKVEYWGRKSLEVSIFIAEVLSRPRKQKFLSMSQSFGTKKDTF